MQTIEMRDPEGCDQVSRKNGGQAWCEAEPGSSRRCDDTEGPRTDSQLMSFLGFANYKREFINGYADKVYPMQKLMRNKGKKFEWSDEAQTALENIKRELCEAPVLGMPTEKGIYVLDTDASVVAISGILH